MAEAGIKLAHGGKLITVFSARDYHHPGSNDSAVLLLCEYEDGARVSARAQVLASIGASVEEGGGGKKKGRGWM